MKSPVPHSVLWGLLFVAQLPLLVLYLLRLHGDPIYGWWPLVALLLVAGLVWLRWDGKSEAPRRLWPKTGLFLGLLSGLAAGVLASGWLAGVSFCCTAGAWLATHHQRPGIRLSPIWYITWSLLQIPLGGNAWLTQRLASSLEHAIKSVLRLGQVPHVSFNHAVEVIGSRIYFDQATYSMLSWPLFVAVAMVHSAVWRRTWFEALFNFLSALFWCFAFHCGLLLSCLRLGWALESWGAAALSILWGAVAFALFLSTERGLRLLLQPISENSFDSRFANPYVIAWNYCFSPRVARSSRRRQGQPWLGTSTAWILIACVAVTLLLQLASIPRAWATLSKPNALALDKSALEAFVFQNQEEVEHRHSYHCPPFVRNREADIWTVYAPLSTTEHVAENRLQPVREIQSLILFDGWQIDSMGLVPTQLADGQALTYGNVALHQGRQHAHLYYAWLASDGSPLPPDGGSGSGYLLISKAELVKVYEAATKRILLVEFSRFLVGVQTQLRDLSSQR